MKGFWNLLCVLTLFAAIVVIIGAAGTLDHALLVEGETHPDGVKTMMCVGVVLMLPSAATVAYRRFDEWYND